MKIFLALLGSLLFVNAHAANNSICDDLKAEQLKLAFTASNLANINSTRTPGGGPYKPFKVNGCVNGGCDVVRVSRTPILKYLPDHPDANSNGYVAYPNIDVKAEYTRFNMAATKLKILGVDGACGSKLIVGKGNSYVALEYTGNAIPQVKEDVFNFNRSGKVLSWRRLDSKGHATLLNFANNGEILLHRE